MTEKKKSPRGQTGKREVGDTARRNQDSSRKIYEHTDWIKPQRPQKPESGSGSEKVRKK